MKTTEFLSVVSVASSLRSIITALRLGPCGHLAIDLEMTQKNIDDLALFEKAVADHIAHPLMLGIGKQSYRRIDVSQVMFRLRDLRLIRCDSPVDLGALCRAK